MSASAPLDDEDLFRLRSEVCEANKEIGRRQLALLTWGNVSGIHRSRGLVAIKPSGVSYDDLTPDRIVIVRLEDGTVVGRGGRPSVDTPTHLELYRRFPAIGGIAHTHSPAATAFAQACREIPCLGTTHADYFHGPIPVTRMLTAEEVESDYETNVARTIIEVFSQSDPLDVPAVLNAGHGPFTWGRTAAEAVRNSMVLEEVARIAWMTRTLAPNVSPLPSFLADRHFRRKHGPGAYYGQEPPAPASPRGPDPAREKDKPA